MKTYVNENYTLTYTKGDDYLTLSLFGKNFLGRRLTARIGKECGLIKSLKISENSNRLGKHTAWQVHFESPSNKTKHFRGTLRLYPNYIIFEIKNSKGITNKKGKHLFGHPYLSFPCFEGDEWENELSMLSFKRQAPFNYPLQWYGQITDSLRDGKHIPLLATNALYETIILSPLNHLLYQTVSISHFPKSIRCGLPRALNKIPKNTTSSTLLVLEQGVNKCLNLWGSLLQTYHQTPFIHPNEDILLEYISYWTNAGSAYWYRPFKKHSFEETLNKLQHHHHDINISFGSYQLDSWWYKRENESYTAGIVDWEPRQLVPNKNYNKILPSKKTLKETRLFSTPKLSHIQQILKKPIGCHFKQLSNHSVYVKNNPDNFKQELFAMPKNKKIGRQLFKEIFTHPNWRISYVVHDWLQWMNDHHSHFKDLSLGPTYFEALDEVFNTIKAPDNQCQHMTLQLCMTQPHMTLNSVTMKSVTTIRSTSDSNSFFIEGAKRWWWHLYASVFIQALGKYPFFDNRRSTKKHTHRFSAFSKLEFIWIGLSCGPLAIGDAIGKENLSLINKCINHNGLLLKPDKPAYLLDKFYLFDDLSKKSNQGVSIMTYSRFLDSESETHYCLYYLLTFNLHPIGKKTISSLNYKDLALQKEDNYVFYDYYDHSALLLSTNFDLTLTMKKNQFYYHLLAPLINDMAFLGDISKHVSCSKALIQKVDYFESYLLIQGAFALNEPTILAFYSQKELHFLCEPSYSMQIEKKVATKNESAFLYYVTLAQHDNDYPTHYQIKVSTIRRIL